MDACTCRDNLTTEYPAKSAADTHKDAAKSREHTCGVSPCKVVGEGVGQVKVAVERHTLLLHITADRVNRMMFREKRKQLDGTGETFGEGGM